MQNPVSIALAVMLIWVLPVFSQENAEIPLWPAGAPGALGIAPADIPAITPYVSATAPPGNGAVIIYPGGGYIHLAVTGEGSDYALFLNQRGITAFVVKYRLASDEYRHPAMFQDAVRAVRYVRANAEKWKIDPAKIGVMGSSAGGHMASLAMTHFDLGNPKSEDPVERVSSRPDFGVLCYSVITMSGEHAHITSRRGLIGPNPSPRMIRQLSSELHVTRNTPPCFIWHTVEDEIVDVENAMDFAVALRKNNVLFDLHIYARGPHGQGLGVASPFYNPLPWAVDLLSWLKGVGMIVNEPKFD